jgi:hypothetical protein
MVVAVCDGNWVEDSSFGNTWIYCDGQISQAAWPPPSFLPPLDQQAAVEILAAAAGLWAVAWAFVKIRSVL